MRLTKTPYLLAMLGVTLTLLIVTVGIVVATGSAWGAETPGFTQVDPDVLRWGLMAGALAASVSALAAGYAVAQVGTAAVGVLAEKPELIGRVLILVGLAEGIAIYGLIVAILIFNRLG
jgi:V/A-type H+-transporting ATPase subunit K